MTDREMLEAAARAAGQERSVAGDLWSNARGMPWNPLTDDGDADPRASTMPTTGETSSSTPPAADAGRTWTAR